MKSRMMLHAAPKIEEILTRISLGPDQDLVRRAYDFAASAHDGQFRHSGEPYIQHVLAVAGMLAEMRLDAETVAAGLLHDVVEDCDVSVEDLEKTFGPAVAQLVDGVTKLEGMKRLGRKQEEVRDEQELESLRKSFLAMAKDARVMMIKLADRLHNMRTLHALSPERQRRMARETMDIQAPLANRLGIWGWKGELEDLAFQYLEPDIYKQIVTELETRESERNANVARHIAHLRTQLNLHGVEADIAGRSKHIYGIYRKMQRKNISLDRVYDVQAIRVIVDTISDCYYVLGIVHSLWNPIPGEFDDYVAIPKPNMYQSLHTAVVGLDGKTLEVQIRTRYMDRIADYGIAAHWRYKEGTRRDRQFEEKIAALRAQIQVQDDEDAASFVQAVQTDLFQDRVYVFTPKGKVIDLPAGATVIDFAYSIHTEIGHRARGAVVNDQWVPLDHVLKTGDKVEIVTSKHPKPSRDWLNPALGYVKSARARSKIRRWFRQQDREQNLVLGRTILERELKRLGLSGIPHDKIAALFDHDNVEDFLAALGFGDITSQQVGARVIEMRRKEEEPDLKELPLVPTLKSDIHVLGTGGLLTRFANCCDPVPVQPIVGYVTRGRGITIHQRECPNVLNVRDPERLIEVSWGTEAQTFPVLVSVLAYDRAGLLHDISGVISKEGLNISGVSIDRDENPVTLYITMEIIDLSQLSLVLARIAKVRNVIEVKRETR